MTNILILYYKPTASKISNWIDNIKYLLKNLSKLYIFIQEIDCNEKSDIFILYPHLL